MLLKMLEPFNWANPGLLSVALAAEAGQLALCGAKPVPFCSFSHHCSGKLFGAPACATAVLKEQQSAKVSRMKAAAL